MSDRRYTFNLATATNAGRFISITVPRGRRDDFFTVIERFSAENGFQKHIRRVKKDVDLFFIDLWRGDIAINCVNHSQVDEFDLAFMIDPTNGGSVSKVDELIPILTSELAAIQGVTVSARSER